MKEAEESITKASATQGELNESGSPDVEVSQKCPAVPIIKKDSTGYDGDSIVCTYIHLIQPSTRLRYRLVSTQ